MFVCWTIPPISTQKSTARPEFEYPVEPTSCTGKGRGSMVPLSDGTGTGAAARGSSGRPPPRLRPIFALLLLGVGEKGQLRKNRQSVTNRTPEIPPPNEAAPQELYRGGCHPVLAIQGLFAPPIQPLIPERWEKGTKAGPTSSLLGPVGLAGEVEDPP